MSASTHLGQVLNNHGQVPSAQQPLASTQMIQDFTKSVPIQITLPAQQGLPPGAPPRVLTIHVPPSALEGILTNLE